MFCLEQCLNRESRNSRKGRFVLIYSDLSQLLEIQAKDRIQKLCEQHKFIVSDTRKVRLTSESLFRKNDPNYAAKSAASVILYEITRI